MTIGTLPDDILLEMFYFYAYVAFNDAWRTLVHVCRRWRNVVFTSPRRLNLKLVCTRTRSVREMLDIWPELPIIILDYEGTEIVESADNVIAALELNDRVSRIDLAVSGSRLERVVAVMQDPFPTLTDLSLWSSDGTAPVISDSFLGGSAPRLRYLGLESIPFPALPKLLSSATDLVDLHLEHLPHSGYISPSAMATCLAPLTKLESLVLEFQSPQSRPDNTSQLSPLQTRIIFPALTHLAFRGVTEYLEDLVTQIDTPLLKDISITFFNQLVFDISQLPQFLRRTETFTILDQARVSFYEQFINVELFQRTGANSTRLELSISCRTLETQLSSLVEVCNSALSTLSTLERLSLRAYIYHGPALVPGQHREHTMAGTFAPLYQCEGSSIIQESCTFCRTCPARTHR